MSDTVSQKSNNAWRDIMCGCLDRDVKPLTVVDIHASIPINVGSESFDFAYCPTHDCIEMQSNSINVTDATPMQDIAKSVSPIISNENITDINSLCNNTMIISGFMRHSSHSLSNKEDTCDLVIIMDTTPTSKTRTNDEMSIKCLSDNVSNASEEEIQSDANYSQSEISVDLENLNTLILDDYAQ